MYPTKKQTLRVLRWLLILAVLIILTWVFAEDFGLGLETTTEFLSPVPIMQYRPMATENDVDKIHNGSFEHEDHDAYWWVDPEPQVFYEPDNAYHGEWVMIQGDWPDGGDEVAYYCWGAGTLDDHIRFVLVYQRYCQSNDAWRQDTGRMSLIRWENSGWVRFTDYFGEIDNTRCNQITEWVEEGWWFTGLEAYTNYDICLSIEALSPSPLRTYHWFDDFHLWALPVVSKVYGPYIANETQ